MSRKPVFIVNPKSNSGRTGERLPEYKGKINRYFAQAEILLTEHRGDGKKLAEKAILEGADLVVAVGGDGTANEVMNGFYDNHKLVNENGCFSVVMCGTGCDFRRTLGWPRDFEGQLLKIKNGQSRFIDVGYLESTGEGGQTIRRRFLNEASLGLSGEIAQRVWQKKGKKNKLAYFLETISSLFGHQYFNLDIETEHEKLALKDISFLVFANGNYFGGGMLIAPMADISDGRAEIISVAKVNYLTALLNALRLYKGTLTELPQVKHMRASTLQVDSNLGVNIPVEIDGEPCGKLPAKMKILKESLKIVW